MTEYQVGIVVPPCGLSDNQLADLGERLKFINNYLGAEGKLVVVTPSLDLRRPELAGAPDQVKHVLHYRAKFDLRVPGPYKPELHGSVGAFLLSVLKPCDEVWCCTGPRQGALASARSSDLYRRAQQLPMKEAVKFKQVPAWVMAALAKDEAKKAKARKEPKWKGVY